MIETTAPVKAAELAPEHLLRCGVSTNYVSIASAEPDEDGQITVTIFGGGDPPADDTPCEAPSYRFAPDEEVHVSTWNLDENLRPARWRQVDDHTWERPYLRGRVTAQLTREPTRLGVTTTLDVHAGEEVLRGPGWGALTEEGLHLKTAIASAAVEATRLVHQWVERQ